MAMSYLERKAQGQARRLAKLKLAELVPMPNTAQTIFEGMAFEVENLTGLPLEVEFVGRVITIKVAR